MKLLVLNNLASGYGDGSIYDFIRAFVQDADEVVLRSSDGTTDLGQFLDDAEDFDMVVASGGDGTIASISHILAHSNVPVLPFPAGTANLLAMNLHSPTETHSLARIARQMQTLDFDIGEMTFSGGEQIGFSIIAGAGYDATIMQGAQSTKHLLGPMAYFSAAFTNPTPQHAQLTLNIDGRTIHTDGIAVLIVNFARIQFDIAVVHENLPRDGLFDIVVLHTKDAWGLIPLFITRLIDRAGDLPDRSGTLEVFRGGHVEVVADPPLQVQYDGEASTYQTPFTVDMIHRGARFVVSDECVDVYGDALDESEAES